jgi:adenosylmethionine-8-amino-7-oxononanoate aminotransferase
MRLNKKQLQKIDRNYIWHPFTQMKEWMEEDIIIISHGKGDYIYDIDGNKYLDAVSSIWCNIHGHANQKINSALKKQIDKISHSTFLGLSNLPAILLAEKLVKILPKGLTRIFYSDNGSTAIEVAIKMAFQYWHNIGNKNRKKFISLNNGYHGDTLGAVSAGGIPLFHDLFKPLLFSSIKAPSPYCYRCELNLTYPSCGLACAEKIDRIARENHDEIAGLLLEPIVQAAGGFIVSPPGYLRRVAEICRTHKIILIADEVATGFMRTGELFAVTHENVTPDIICLSKGLTSGYLPLAVTAANEEIFNAFLGRYEEFKTFFHGHTYTGNQLGCAAAIASLDLLLKPDFIKKIRKKIVLFEEELSKLNELRHVGEIRQKGMMIGIEIVKDKKTKEMYEPWERIGHRICKDIRKYEIFLRPLGNVIVIMPPLSITEKEITHLVNSIYKSIKFITETDNSFK